MLHYLLQILIFQLIFLLIYDILFKKVTFFNSNRLYLLIAPFLSIVLPFIEIDFLNFSTAETYVSTIERTITIAKENIISVTNSTQTSTTTSSQSIHWWFIIYISGILIRFLQVILKFHKLYILKNVSLISRISDKRIIILPNSSHAFSFWNTIFLGDSLTASEKKNIISHELVHINQKHTIDQLCVEMLKVLLWWNPIIYIYQARITLLHEYIADSVTINTVDQRNYIEQLLNTAFQTEKITFTNQFFNQSLIKKRILMLQKAQSKSIAKFKYLLLIPLITGILIYTSCNKESEQDAIEETINKNYSTENSIESPCANRDAKYDETLNNYLEIKNGEQAEIIAQLILIETSDIIRTIHLDKGQTYKIRHIPEGIYRVDVVYGEGYIQGPTAGKCEGIFKNKKLSETGFDKLDYHVIPRENGKDVPSYSLAVDMLPEQTRNQNSDVKSKSIDMQTSQENKATNSFISSSATNKISKNQAEPNCANQDPSRYDYDLDNYLKISVSNKTDIIIDLISSENSKSFRTVYIPKNTTYSIRNIPEGNYTLNIVYGEGYQEKLVNGTCSLSFKNEFLREDSVETLDFNGFKSSKGYSIPNYAMVIDYIKPENSL